MATLSIDSLWTFLQSLSLSASNEQWLADRLYASAAAKKNEENNAQMVNEDSLYEVSPRLRALEDGFICPPTLTYDYKHDIGHHKADKHL